MTWRINDITPRAHQLLFDKIRPIVTSLQEGRDDALDELEDVDDAKKGT
jgi:hypothetical protein